MSLLNRAIGQQSGAHLGVGEATGLFLLRNYIAYRGAWYLFLTGFLEPVFYLFSIGVGVGQLVTGFEFNGEVIPYAEFVAPGMLAASAMNGALLDSTFNFFFKLKYEKLFDQMLATPLTTADVARGELAWSLLRGGIYSLAFLLVMVAMDLVGSWWAVLAAPAALLIGFAFGGACMALTTYMRSWQDFDYVTLGTLPLFLFSATFFPITAFPTWLQWVVEFTPLYRGVVLVRELTTGVLTWGSAVSVVYLLGDGAARAGRGRPAARAAAAHLISPTAQPVTRLISRPMPARPMPPADSMIGDRGGGALPERGIRAMNAAATLRNPTIDAATVATLGPAAFSPEPPPTV